MKSNKILIADDHLIVRTGMETIINTVFPQYNLEQTDNYIDAKAKIELTNYDLIILDINMPGSKNKDMIKELRDIQPDLKILIFSMYESENLAIQYIMAGANGYLNKLSKEIKIVDAIKTILENEYYYPPELVNKIVRASMDKTQLLPLEILSKRELEIAELFAEGNGNIEISNKLNLQMSTISTYKNRIFEKLNIKNVVELINLFEEKKQF